MRERVGSRAHGISTRLGSTGLKISRLGTGLRQLRRHRLGAGVLRDGRERSAGVRADGPRVRCRASTSSTPPMPTAAAAARATSDAGCTRRAPPSRQQLLLSSKVFNPVGPGPNDRGLSRAHILRQVDASLSRLQTDRLDMYLIHEPDPETPLEETLRALDDLVRAGKVLYVGASNIEAWRLARGAVDQRRAAPGVASSGCRTRTACSTARRSARCFRSAKIKRVGFTAFSPLAGGWLTGKYRSPGAYPAGSRMTLRPEPYRHLISDARLSRSGRVRRTKRALRTST